MKDNKTPPSWFNRIVDRLAPLHLREEICGDLHEMFLSDVSRLGVWRARQNYILNGIGFLMRTFFWQKSPRLNSTHMFGIYFKMAHRSLMAHKSTTVINVIGLVVGLTSALALFSFIKFELSFDTFHSNADRIYRLIRVSGDDRSEIRGGVSYPVSAALQRELSGVEKITSIEYFRGANVEVFDSRDNTVNRFREEAGFAIVEPSFFDVFDFNGTPFKWISGNPETALDEAMCIVLTRSMAQKYFGDQEVLGKSVRLQNKIDFKVTGVIEDFPPNTDLPFTVLISYSTLTVLAGETRMNDWVSVNDSHQTFLRIAPDKTPEELEQQIAQIHAVHTTKELSSQRHYVLQRLGEMHFEARPGTFNGRTISMETLAGLGIVAIFVVLIAAVNYINLSTAQASLRAKEVGLRKTMGSSQSSIALHFFTETFLIVFTASVVALVLSDVILNNLEALLEITHSTYNMTDPGMLLALGVTVLIVTLLAGIYPALVLARFNPVRALKHKFANQHISGLSLRKVLVLFQFTITQILVVGTYLVVSQMEFFSTFDMGFNKDGIINARIPNRKPATLQVMEDQLRALSFVENVSFSYTLPGGVRRNGSYADVGLPDAANMNDYVVYEYVAIDESFLPLYEIELLAGRNLQPGDSTGNILINETLARSLALGSPDEAIGKDLKLRGNKSVTVVGVVEDYYSHSMKESVNNIIMQMEPENYSIVGVKLNMRNSNSVKESVAAIGDIWQKTFPEYMFNYTFLDENVAAYYKQEEKYATLFEILSLIFVAIGALGLYGLMAFVVNRKEKEVAIRKVLGASITSILTLFSKEYIMLVVLSFVVAVPITYYLINDWLSNFKEHISLAWYSFTIPGFIVLLVAMLVISSKSIRAAFTNPTDHLKYDQ